MKIIKIGQSSKMRKFKNGVETEAEILRLLDLGIRNEAIEISIVLSTLGNCLKINVKG